MKPTDGTLRLPDMFIIFVRLFAIFAALLLSPATFAAESAGVILALSGKVDVVHEEKLLPATRTTTLYSGDVIVTGDGQVQIRFADGTLLSLYRDTRFAVNDYHYGRGNGDRAQFSLVNGLMHTMTGKIDKNSYQIKTRLANLGVRGTEYSVSLDKELHVSVDEGIVSITNAAGTLMVSAGSDAVITASNAMPRPGGGRIGAPGGGGPRGQGGGGLGAGGGPGAGAMGAGGAGPSGAGGAGAPPPPPPGTRKF